MNWQEKFVQIIMKQYPKSIALMRGNFKSSQIWKLQYMSNPRLLFDFFDKQGIYVWITPPFGTDEGLDIFDGEIRLVNGNYLFERISVCGTKTRTLAEEQAFLQAFKILEEKL